jgi:alkanesulfonate monooxygenase SsuD/methylene tetrahydromethanopterin reductase-like flavin-dependent oxidoreductase (luciferase family)
MKFALFYEIPVPKPWGPDSELIAYQNTLEQAIAGDRFGWDAFWTVEHHFLQEYSHCSNPEVLYGAIASRTERIRLGYGVRLMPKPYNHPVRTAESVAVLDLLSGGRVDMGAGRSATRAELEGFGIDPSESRSMWQEAIGHIVGCWTNEEYEFSGTHWQMPKRRVQPKPLQKPHPPLWGATTSDEGHGQMGDLGLGLCSFAVGLPPAEVKRKIDIYRAAVNACTEPIGAFVHNQAATFTMAICAADRNEAIANARESFEWYPKTGARQIATLTDWMAERKQELGTYAYAADMKSHDDQGLLDLISLEYLMDSNACVLGTPEECIESCRQYEEAGVDLLLCLVNPYNVSHEAVMETIELMGTEVIPKFRS